MPQRRDRAGSPDGEPDYLPVGLLRRPHGVSGEILFDPQLELIDRVRAGSTAFLGAGLKQVVIAAVRLHHAGLLVKFRGLDTPEDVGLYRNTWLFMTRGRGDAPARPYRSDLVGMQVIDEHGAVLGAITGILETGANDVYVVTAAERAEILIPAVAGVILRIDPEARAVHVQLPAGLFDASARRAGHRG